MEISDSPIRSLSRFERSSIAGMISVESVAVSRWESSEARSVGDITRAEST